MSREIALLVNPTAGRGRGMRYGLAAADQLRRAGVGVRELTGRDAGEAATLARAAAESGASALVVVGGDGMVHLGLQVVAGTSTTLGVIPAGTGNDVARLVGLPRRDPRAAADIVAEGRVRAIDATRCAGETGQRWYVTVLAAGFDARVNDRVNRMTWPRGRLRYDLAVLAELREFRPLRYVLDLDGERWTTDAMLVAVGNGPSYGGGMRVCPDAAVDDGLLEVVVVGTLSKQRFVRLFPTVFTGRHVRHSEVTVRRARRVTVTAAGVTAYADGERVGALPITCETVRGALKVLGPAPA
ncbi:MAG: diacylglycerol kinase [Carbonactinosporaceae bacterium]